MFLRIVPLGNLPKEILEAVRNDLENLNIRCRIMPTIDIPQEAFNHWRRQYNAEIIMNCVYNKSEVKFIDANIPSLLLTDYDLYYSGLNFVFGLEYPSKSCAIVSLARLKPEFYDERPDKNLLNNRAAKEVLHEIGQYLGLGHCQNTKCVMAFSSSTSDIDKKQKDFCDSCKMELTMKGISLG
jgi:archaemetzincin